MLNSHPTDTFDNAVRRDKYIVENLAMYIIRKFKETECYDPLNGGHQISTEALRKVFKTKITEIGIFDALRKV